MEPTRFYVNEPQGEADQQATNAGINERKYKPIERRNSTRCSVLGLREADFEPTQCAKQPSQDDSEGNSGENGQKERFRSRQSRTRRHNTGLTIFSVAILG